MTQTWSIFNYVEMKSWTKMGKLTLDQNISLIIPPPSIYFFSDLSVVFIFFSNFSFDFSDLSLACINCC